ncbi:MAG: hypothetical protein QM755_06105 [Luteolibacter sp.]
MKISIPISLFVVCGGLAAVRAETPRQYIVESKPLCIGDLEFVTVTERKWSGAPTSQRDSKPLELQFRITNLSDKEVVFPTFDTFRPVIFDSTGKEVQAHGGRDATFVTPAIVIPPKGSFALVRSASLEFHEKDKRVYFLYRDATGSSQTNWLVPGSYQVAFSFDAADRGPGVKPDPATWTGKGTTPAATFEYVAKP